MIGMLSALVNSERSGRIARKDMLDTMEKMFLTGAQR
jgi:TetR/AcrR family transcriptional regulator, mexCD-oprJ operon repressor